MAKNEIRIQITGDASKFNSAADTAEKHLREFTGKVSGMGGKLSGAFSSFLGNLGAIGVSKGLDTLLSVGKDSLAEAEEAQKVSGITSQLVKQTGADGWTSAKAVGALATAISNKVGIDDEAIQSGENVLLTFRNVRNEAGAGNDIFNRATKVAVDLSAVMGGDLAGANKQLGKALQDPVKGLTMLGRAGVQFTQQQQDQIKALVASGHSLEAQKVILKEVETQVGGTAEKGATSTEKLTVMWKNVEEEMGNVMLPILKTVTGWLSDHLPAAIDTVKDAWGKVWPQIKGVWDSVGQPIFDAISGAVQTVAGMFSGGGGGGFGGIGASIKKTLGPIVDWLKSYWSGSFKIITAVFDSLRGWWDENGPSIVAKVQEIFGKIGPVISRLAEVTRAVVGLILGLWNRFGDDILNVVKGAWDAVSGVISAALDIIKGVIDVVMGIIHGDWGRVWDGIKEIFGGVWDAIIAILKGAWGIIKGVLGAIYDAVTGILGAAWNWLKGAASDVWNAVVGFFTGAWGRISGALSAVASGIRGALSAVWGWIKNTAKSAIDGLVGFFTGLPGRILRVATTLFNAAKGLGSRLMDGIGAGLKAAAGWAGDIGKTVVNAIIGFINKQVIHRINTLVDFHIGPVHINPPDIPSIPTLHTGGVFNSGKGEGLALLKDGETVRTVQQERRVQTIVNGALRGSGATTITLAEGAIQIVATPDVDAFDFGRKVLAGIQAQARHGGAADMRLALGLTA